MELADHRRLGRQLGIFSTEEECGAGLPFWQPAGAVVRRELEQFVVELERAHGYRHVSTPVMTRISADATVVGAISSMNERSRADRRCALRQ